MKMVFFDFDGTLTTRDSLHEWFRWMARVRRRGLLVALYCILYGLFRVRILSHGAFKRGLVRLLLSGVKVEEAVSHTRQFMQRFLKTRGRRRVIERLSAHSRSGDRVIIVSSNYDIVVEAFISLLGIPVERITTVIESVNGVYTGKLTMVLSSRRKKALLLRLFGEALSRAIYYGDREDCTLSGAVGEYINVAQESF